MAKPIQDYKSRHNDAESKKFGTFSYLPKMNASSIRQQVQYMIGRGWNCAVEHVEPEMATSDYWYMWKLPLFGERGLDVIMAELTACRNANPRNHVRIIGYDNKRQTQGQSFVVYRGNA
ncbi:MAG TPA: ribulose bisphosphate carboxylase small subunit [Woeseiaceae bacterium]|nr:ribulose bisphosphate carboxylase small subunit [Woeseiaceae bacterium]